MVAIVTDVHYRMSLALIRDLRDAGVEVVTCERDALRSDPSSPALGALSRAGSRHVWLPEERTLDALWDLCRSIEEERGCRPALLPVGAATLGAVSTQRERFDEVAGLCIPTPDQLDVMNSKERLAALAEELSVPVPESFSRQNGESAEAFAARLPLPCVIKPVCGEKLGLGASQRYAIVKSSKEAQAHFLRFRDLAGEDPVVQTYLPGGGMGCSVLALGGKVLAAISHRRLREYPVSGGPSSCCVCENRPDLRAYAEKLVAETGYTGLAMFEFKEDADGKPRLLEVNPRIWGTFPLTRVSRSGIPYLWCVLSWNMGNLEKPEALPPVQQPQRKKMIFAASDLMAAVGYAKRGQGKKSLQALGDLINPTVRDGLFEWRDPRPGLAYFRSLLRKGRHA